MWIHQNVYGDLPEDAVHPQGALYRQMREQKIAVRRSTLEALTGESLDGVDLVLIDAFDDFGSVVQIAAVRVRIKSRVPLVLLTHDYSSEQLVLALRSGVDALLSYQTPPDLLMARCNALLRRWRANATTRQKP